jgi:hypothetical protein
MARAEYSGMGELAYSAEPEPEPAAAPAETPPERVPPQRPRERHRCLCHGILIP